jgi:FdhD protein
MVMATGVTVLAAISAPTALAIHLASSAGLTVVGVVRDDAFAIFSHPDRIRAEQAEDAA